MALTKITPQMFDTSAAGHDFNIDNGTFVVDASANRVGIGTATPSALLDVNGTINTTNFTVGGAQGTDGQVLTSTGSGVQWEAISGGGGGAWNVISSQTVSSAVATLEFTSITGYTHYMINISNLKSSNNKELQIVCAYGTSLYTHNKIHNGNYSSQSLGELMTAQSTARISKDMSSAIGGTVQMWFGSTSSVISFRSAAVIGTTQPVLGTGVMANMGSSERDANINKIKFSFQSGNIDAGTFTLYGLAIS